MHGLFKNLKARILKSIITWSTLGKQTAQAKEVYCDVIDIEKKVFKELDIELYICTYNLSATNKFQRFTNA